MTRGNAYFGTSGFAYPDWAPRFYSAGLRAGELLSHYSSRLPAVELNNTFYQQPKPDKIAAWLAATPDDFRFVVKAQRGGSMRAFSSSAAETVAWLTAPYRLFGERLGAVLYRVPENMHRDDEKLRLLLEAWPPDMPLVVEMQNAEWQVDEVFDLLSRHSATLCATDLDDRDPPDLRLTGRTIYLRLRRTTYGESDLADWAGRLSAFLESGTDCYVFFRHDDDGTSALRALRLIEMLAVPGARL
ncbi:MAG: hypothetical protein QOJ81_115 [Chloroflexota bacterium]|nr:hypothetical protein [Chloroflexota bacterium]